MRFNFPIKKSCFTLFLLFTLSFLALPLSQAATKIWEQPNNPANYVVLEGIKDAKAEDLILNHPYTFDPKKLTDMFLSLRYNKALLFKKDIQDQRVIIDPETLEHKIVPHLVEAFERADPNQVVVVSMVQKDPFFIIRNDRLSVIRAFVAQDGLHLIFLKTNAKLDGDYQAHTTGRKLIDTAKGLHVTLEPQEGQKLSFADPREIILDLNYDFASSVDKKAAPPPSAPPQTPEERLKNLKKLKEQGLITPQEYEAKRKEILKGL